MHDYEDKLDGLQVHCSSFDRTDIIQSIFTAVGLSVETNPSGQMNEDEQEHFKIVSIASNSLAELELQLYENMIITSTTIAFAPLPPGSSISPPISRTLVSFIIDCCRPPPLMLQRGYARPGLHHAYGATNFTTEQKKKIYLLFLDGRRMNGYEAFKEQRLNGTERDPYFINPEHWISSTQFTSQFSRLTKLRNDDEAKFKSEIKALLPDVNL
jgi:hypothetical protein